VTGGIWLALDTATEIASVAAGRPPAAASGAHVRGARRHAAELLRLVEFTLSRAGVAPRDLEGIVVGDGPGSFTGLRVGWAAAKGLLHEAGLELWAIPSLMAAAAGAALRLGPQPVAACFDALRGQVYGAVYAFHPDRVETLVAPAALTVEELARAAPERPRLAVGDGAVRYADAVARWTGAAPVPLDALPPAATMLLALVGRPGAGRAVPDPATAEPEYGRPAAAQARWEAQHGRPLPDSPGPTG
jgi:tRNA threonylcarbamoyladenosine biosynthesis protein TsaB